MNHSLVFFIAVLILSFPAPSRGEEPPPYLLELLPAGTHFHDGDTKKGLLFLLSETAFLGGGLAFEHNRDGELNVPLIFSGQLYTIDKCDYERHRLGSFLLAEAPKGPVRCDMRPLSEIMAAPFRKETLLSPFVLAFAALGIVDGYAGYPRHDMSFHDIERVYIGGGDLSRDTGTTLYMSSAAALSWGAAVSEEMLFRGVMLPALDYRFGRRTGLASSSAVFGLLHLFNGDIDNPSYFVLQATAAGFAFGWHVQRHGYRLDEAVAAHFWYDMASMATTWLANPRENPIGFGISFRL